jgi:nicotinamide phosphoribosyltransferase
MNPLFYTDYYKVHHHNMYPAGTTKIYSNMTPRKSRIPGVDYAVVFGIQYLLYKYLIHEFSSNFFMRSEELIVSKYKQFMDLTLGKDSVSVDHIRSLHKLGYLPIKIKTLPEGTRCPIGVPLMTITNTHPDHAWLVNYLETLISAVLWQPITSATLADRFYKICEKYALETTGSADFVKFQGHDFSARGMSSIETMGVSGMAHLAAGFCGTDTIYGIQMLRHYYEADIQAELVGTSVPATEHSVMCMGTKEGEIDTLKRLLTLYPKGILSVVYDTWDLFGGLIKVGEDESLKKTILTRDGKLVFRPDSGDPVDILCGTVGWVPDETGTFVRASSTPAEKGVIELLWDIFGGTTNAKGYRELDSHIGAIYGDSINADRAVQIFERLKAKGFASTNVVLGVGSYTYQYNTRDTLGFAVKATYGEVKVPSPSEESGWTIERREIFKDPITDDGTKKSAKGLLAVARENGDGKLILLQQVTEAEEKLGLLETVFENGEMNSIITLEEIRSRLRAT